MIIVDCRNMDGIIFEYRLHITDHPGREKPASTWWLNHFIHFEQDSRDFRGLPDHSRSGQDLVRQLALTSEVRASNGAEAYHSLPFVERNSANATIYWPSHAKTDGSSWRCAKRDDHLLNRMLKIFFRSSFPEGLVERLDHGNQYERTARS